MVFGAYASIGGIDYLSIFHCYVLGFESSICDPILLMFVYIASASIHACRHSGMNLIAFENAFVTFNATLAPLCDSQPSPIVGDLQSMNIVDRDKKRLFEKFLMNPIRVHKFLYFENI